MKAIWLSDLHIEFHMQDKKDKFFKSLRDIDASCILITGDTSVSPSIKETLIEMQILSGKPIYFVLGNHDFYAGSIEETRKQVNNLGINLFYLHNLPFLSLTQKTAVVGYDGWYDGLEGDYFNSNVNLNDFYDINEFIGLSKNDKLILMRKLSNTKDISSKLVTALTEHENVILLTHVPPFKQNSLHKTKTGVGKVLYETANKDFLPFFANGVLGIALKEIMKYYPKRHLTVLSGHTHTKSRYTIDNIYSMTLDAEYKVFPSIKIIDVD